MIPDETKPATTTAFRVAAGPRIGVGHLNRALALAAAAEFRGGRLVFAVNEVMPSVAPSADDVPGMVEVVEAGDGTTDIDETAERAEAMRLFERCDAPPDLVIVDHYRRGLAFEETCRAHGSRVLAIDDLARSHEADIVVDPAPTVDEASYASAAPTALRLLGSAYAPLKPSIVSASRMPQPARDDKHHVLISLGGADPDGVAHRALSALAPLSSMIRISVVSGPLAQHASALRRTAVAAGAEVLEGVGNMARLLKTVDLAVGAGGVSALERCCLGVPSLLVEIALNQRRTVSGIVAAGAGQALEPARFMADLPDAVSALLADEAGRRRMAKAGRRLCDGRGAARLAAIASSPVVDREGEHLHLRPATFVDCERLFELQTAPEARFFARNPQPPTWTEHCAWLKAVTTDPDRLLLVVRRENCTVGSVRYDLNASGHLEVSILIGSEAAGRGVGRLALGLGETEAAYAFPQSVDWPIWAYIKPENTASLRVFAAAGYRTTLDRPGWMKRISPWKGRRDVR